MTKGEVEANNKFIDLRIGKFKDDINEFGGKLTLI